MAMQLRLSDPERAALERIREERHSGTAAAALRDLIREADPEGETRRRQRLQVDQSFGPRDRQTLEGVSGLLAQLVGRFGINPDDSHPEDAGYGGTEATGDTWIDADNARFETMQRLLDGPDPELAGRVLGEHVARGPKT